MVKRKVDPAQVRAAVQAVAAWVESAAGVESSAGAAVESDPGFPGRGAVAAAVRGTAQLVAQDAPGQTVEVRIPPYAAIQCLDGTVHTRGTPPNVIETDTLTWLRLVLGDIEYDAAVEQNLVLASGQRCRDVARWLPIIPRKSLRA